MVFLGLKQLGLKVEGNPATVVTLAIAALSLLVRGAGPLPIDLAASHLIQSIRVGWYDVSLRAVGEPG